MGAQDERQTWVELPFWRLIKYYVACFLAGFSVGVAFVFANLHLYLYTFYTVYWWTIPSTLAIALIITYLARLKRR